MMLQAGGYLLVLALMLPVAGILLLMALDARHAGRITLGLMPLVLAVSLVIAARVWTTGAGLEYLIGGWAPPLGVSLRADGVSAVMLVTTAVVIGAAGLFARVEFRQPEGQPEARAPLMFWLLLLGVWAGLNAVFLGSDLFNLYVALEMLTFAAVPLVCLSGKVETLAAALRYLLFALLGSALYLLGAVLLYGAYGTLDIALLAGRVAARTATGMPGPWLAMALMTAGLLAKTALFPLHLWLPPAHSGAPAAASAVLSALVVKASFFLIVRRWFGVLPGLTPWIGVQLLAALGAAAILFGSAMALRQARLKLLVAYSTVAQIGYLFFLFPLAGNPAASAASAALAWTGGWMQLVSHALAKAAMFMAAGLIAEAFGHDRIAGLSGVARVVPITVVAFGLAGASLMGLPPSGGFVAKLLLLSAAVAQGQWLWALVMLLGGLLAGGYLFRVLSPSMSPLAAGWTPVARIARNRQAVALVLALGAVLLGLAPLRSYDLLQIGRPAIAGVTAR